MFVIRRIHDDLLSVNQRALASVQQMLREQFRGLPEAKIAELPGQLRNPSSMARRVLLVAENQRGVRGFAMLMYAPDLRFGFLDFIAAARKETSQGIGGALYERVREECRMLGAAGLYFECLPDDPSDVQDRRALSENIARLRFYEQYGARPIDRTDYRRPVRPEDTEQPYLVYDDLGSGRTPRRDEARAIVRAILERNYAWVCPPDYVQRVVDSFVDDPVVLRAYRYVEPRAVPHHPSLRAPLDARVLLIMNDKHDIHHVRERGYVEAPVRISAIRRELNKLDLFRIVEPKTFPDHHVTEVHEPAFVRYLKRICASLPNDQSVYPYVFPVRNAARPPRDLAVRAGYYCIDTFTPLNRNAWPAARRAVDCALTGASALLSGTRLAYVLVRPPGHHAEYSSFGGFCYLNSAAIAAQYLSPHGRIAILDIDYHHGNGQQEIFYKRPDILTVSIHGHPSFAYPYFSGFPSEVGDGPGRGANLNLALAEQIDGAQYARVLERALSRIRVFAPRFLVVCLGLDTAKADPTGTWSLRSGDFERNGKLIGQLALPTLIVQEGGYNTRYLGTHARHFFAGLWAGAAAAGGLGGVSSRARRTELGTGLVPVRQTSAEQDRTAKSPEDAKRPREI